MMPWKNSGFFLPSLKNSACAMLVPEKVFVSMMSAVDVLDHIRPRERKDVAVVQQILLIIQEARAACVGLLQPIAADGRPHGTVDDQDALAHGGFEFRAAIRAGGHGGC